MLKTALATGPANKNPEQGSQEIQVENQDEKEPAQKSCKKTAKSKKWIRAEKAEAFRAKNLNSQSGFFFTSEARKSFTKLR